MTRNLAISFLVLNMVFLTISCNRLDKDIEDDASRKKWEETDAREFFTVSDLNKEKPKPGIYETEGYVADTQTFKCDCPPGQVCRCPPDRILISEGSVKPPGATLWIQTDPSGFRKGERYRFKIRIRERSAFNKKIYEVFLAAHKRMEND